MCLVLENIRIVEHRIPSGEDALEGKAVLRVGPTVGGDILGQESKLVLGSGEVCGIRVVVKLAAKARFLVEANLVKRSKLKLEIGEKEIET